MYYLQSRYYNPTWGRFINADALVSTGQGILGNNMFAYCLNNPVSHSDYSGTVPTRFISRVCLGGEGSRAKQPLTTIEKFIYAAGLEFGVDPAMVAAVIAVEQAYNVDIFDLADVPAGLIGVDTSVGYGQVRISTAQLLENTGYIEESGSRCQRILRLLDRKTNIRYVAAYLAYMRDIWILQDPDFEAHPAVWWTVFNTGKIQAHPNPQAGLLGNEANAFYTYYAMLFGQ